MSDPADDLNELHLAAFRRELAARNRSAGTWKEYRKALTALARFHPGADLTDLTKADIQDHLAAMLERCASATVASHFRSLHAFYTWCEEEERVERSPMARMKLPSVTQEPVPVLHDDELRDLLKVCGGRDFEARRDLAIIRMFCEAGSPRVSEMAGIEMDWLDMRRDQVRVHGKGDKYRDIPFGPGTGKALDRYLLSRRRHKKAPTTSRLWLGPQGPLTASGIYQMVERRGEEAGIKNLHPHRLRHSTAHAWFASGGSEQDAMSLFGWTSAEMPRRYGASARTERAHQAARRQTIADRL